MLKDHANYLETMHPNLARQIHDGLMLALLGRVTPMDTPHNLDKSGMIWLWDVVGTSRRPELPTSDTRRKVYSVKVLQTTPRRWSCNCEQGQSYAPLIGEFLGHPGKICKHIAAVAIHWLNGQEITRPASIYEMVSRLVQGQAIYLLAGESLALPHPSGIKLEYYDKNGKSGLCLKTGRARSEILARWLPVEGDPGRACEWRLVSEAQGQYTEFVEKINGGAK